MHKARSTYVPIRVRQPQASIHRVGESQHVVQYLHLAVFSKPTKKLKSARANTQCTRYNQKQLVMREDCAFIYFQSQHDICNTFFLFCTSWYDVYMRRPGCFPGAWSSWHFLQVVSLHLILDPCPLHSHWFVQIFNIFPYERAKPGGSRPRSEAPCMYNLVPGTFVLGVKTWRLLVTIRTFPGLK